MVFNITEYTITSQKANVPVEYEVDVVTNDFKLHVGDVIDNVPGDRWIVIAADGNKATIKNMSISSFRNIIGLWGYKFSTHIEKA